jgi:signal peptidase II
MSDSGSASGAPRPASPAPLLEKSLLFTVALTSIILDHLSKRAIEAALPMGETWAPFPGLDGLFQISHVTNTGAAFGVLSSGSAIFGVIAVIVSGFIVYCNTRLPANSHGYRIALGLQMGGAIGNLIDRIRLGHVTDFLDFGPWPVFNLADLSIVLGVVLMGWLMLREQRATTRAGQELKGAVPAPAGEPTRPDETQDALI